MMNILFVDDDPYSMATYVDVLTDAGFHVQKASGAAEAIREVAGREFAAVVLDVRMSREELDEVETAGGNQTGIALARRIRQLRPRLSILLLTLSEDAAICEWARKDHHVVYLNKRSVRPHNLVRHVRKALREPDASPNIFLVHGKNHGALLAVKNYLQNTLGFSEPTVLAHKPNDGRTIIEKFEYFANDADVVIVLLTPDDLGRTADTASPEQSRARQNVILELGYFWGTVGRQYGKIVLLNDNVQDIPTDISGMILIDISHGIDAASEEIRRELAQWL
ncbi:MAG TPA: TIR domain-containing protein [Kofleriaceae bacterium]